MGKWKITACVLAAAALVTVIVGRAALRLPAREGTEPQSVAETASASAPAVSPTPTPTPTPTPDPSPDPTPEPTPEPERRELDYDAAQPALTLSLTAEQCARLTDGDYGTKLRFDGETAVTLECPEPVSGLYLVWDAPPGAWQAAGEGWTAAFGEHEFLHEFAELPEAAERLELTVPAGAVLCDIYAFTDGRLPDRVQVWSPPAEEADLLLFPTHGDDEHLFFGGTMPYYAGELGLAVQVVYLTNHWNEQPRPHEQLDGLWTVGIRNYPVFGPFVDRYCADLAAAQSMYGADNVVRFQAEMIRRFRPLAIVGHDVNGEYGHGAHQLNGRSLNDAAESAADPDFDAESAAYGVWDTPKLYLHLWPEQQIVMDWDVPLERFGGLTAFEVAKEGYRQHTSQQKWAFHVYPRDEYYSCYRFGLVRSTVGEDVEKNDFLENVPLREELEGNAGAPPA